VTARHLAAVLTAGLVVAAGCGSVTATTHDGGGGGAAGARAGEGGSGGVHDGGGGAAGAQGDSSTGTDAPRDLAAGQDHVSASDAPSDRTSVPHLDANSDGIVTGGQCGSDTDCKQYSDGIGGCCGACVPVTDPEPQTVQCLLPCLTPIKSCTCVNHQCTGSTTLL
jgi:hypothetical protein